MTDDRPTAKASLTFTNGAEVTRVGLQWNLSGDVLQIELAEGGQLVARWSDVLWFTFTSLPAVSARTNDQESPTQTIKQHQEMRHL